MESSFIVQLFLNMGPALECGCYPKVTIEHHWFALSQKLPVLNSFLTKGEISAQFPASFLGFCLTWDLQVATGSVNHMYINSAVSVKCSFLEVVYLV